MQVNNIIILTGDIQTGKTTFLYYWIKGKANVAGILTPVKKGKRFFYDIADDIYSDMETTGKGEAVLKVGRFVFSANAFKIASDKLLLWSNENKWGYIIIDEIGPLELNQHKGFYNALMQLIEHLNTRQVLLLVVRTTMLDIAVDFFKQRNKAITIFDIEHPEILNSL